MAKIKIEENASKVSDQDPLVGISGVTSKARNVAKSRLSIYNQMAMT